MFNNENITETIENTIKGASYVSRTPTPTTEEELPFKLIYQNFDNLDITFQGALPQKLLDQLMSARNQAEEENAEVYIELGEPAIQVRVAATGRAGGYKFRFDTGLDGETWFIANSVKSDNWGIAVSSKSLALSLYGYKGVKARILEHLGRFGAKGVRRIDPITKQPTETPLERISRADFCFDLLMPTDFNPDPHHFICHQKTNKKVFGQIFTHSSGEKVKGIQIGSIRGRQLVVYNKQNEIDVHNKKYWWDIWNLDPAKTDGTVWRIEVRAGRDEIDNWNAKRFDVFEKRAGAIFIDILKANRYITPSTSDSNRWRWPMNPLWSFLIRNAYKELDQYISPAKRGKIFAGYKEEKIDSYKKLIKGLVIGHAAACGVSLEDIPDLIKKSGHEIMSEANKDRKKFERKYSKAKERFEFIC